MLVLCVLLCAVVNMYLLLLLLVVLRCFDRG